jgi:Flp pilus assembly protein RcpC/CpaB
LAICGLIGLAAPFGVLALLSAQAKLDQRFELYVQGADNAPLQMPPPNMSAEVNSRNEPELPRAMELAHTDRVSTPTQPAVADVMPAEGKKAVVVRISNGLNAIDFARPGRWVDVVLTRQVEPNSIINDVIVQNARILAVDADAESGDRSMARSVTLEVDLVDAQKLLLATQVGFLSVILSRPGDRPQDVRQVDIDDLTTNAGTADTQTEATAATVSAAPSVPATPAAPVAAPESETVPAPQATPSPEAAPISPEVATTSEAAPISEAPPPATMPPASTPSAAVAAETIEQAREPDDSRYGWVTVRRPGADPSVHRVPRE